MTTFGQLIDQVINETLIGTYRAHFNTLAADITPTATDLTTAFPLNGIGEGSLIALGAELAWVIPGGLNENSKLLTCVRGMRGTTAVAHLAGIPIEINPRFPRFSILNAMQDEILSWPADVYWTKTVSTNVAAGVTAIPTSIFTSGAPGGVNRVIKVWLQRTGTDTGRWVKQIGWKFEPDMDDGPILFLNRNQACATPDSYKLLVGLPFLDPTTPVAIAETTSLIDLHMSQRYGELLKLGAAFRLVQGRETRRLFTEAESDGAKPQEVPVQANTALAGRLKQMRDARLADEINFLRNQHGMHRV